MGESSKRHYLYSLLIPKQDIMPCLRSSSYHFIISNLSHERSHIIILDQSTNVSPPRITIAYHYNYFIRAIEVTEAYHNKYFSKKLLFKDRKSLLSRQVPLHPNVIRVNPGEGTIQPTLCLSLNKQYIVLHLRSSPYHSDISNRCRVSLEQIIKYGYS